MAEKYLIEEFLKQFKVSIINAGIYFEEHPVFVRSIDKVKHILDDILSASSPFFIGITPGALLIGGEYLKENKVYIDLARHFHYRKIKSIAFSSGVTINDLSAFLLIAASSFKDVAESGGIKQRLLKDNVQHISVQELDYLELLENTEGDEDKDIWKFLIEKAYYDKTLPQALKNLGGNFEKIMYKFSSDDLKNDPSFMLKVIEVLRYIKKEDPQKFKDYSEALAKFVLDRGKFIPREGIIGEVGNLLKDIDSTALSNIIWERNFDNNKFDAFSLELFSKFLDNDTQKIIARDIENKWASNKAKFNNSQTKDKLKELVSSFDNKSVSIVYKNTLTNLLKRIEVNGAFNLEYKPMYESYAYSLLNMFCLESEELRLEVTASCIIKEWPRIVELKDINIIKLFLNALEEKIKASSGKSVGEIYSNVKKHIISSLEDVVFDNMEALDNEDVLFFSGFISSVKFGAQAYITKIMGNESSREKIMRLFFKLFPDDTELLFNALRGNIYRSGLANSIINVLGRIDTKESLELLKDIFAIANFMLRVDILEVMRNMSVVDEKFILKLLRNHLMSLRKGAFRAIAGRSADLNSAAVNNLLSIFNPFGIRNGTLIDNIRIIAEENIKEAKSMLESISGKYYFWKGAALRKIARETLNKIEKDE